MQNLKSKFTNLLHRHPWALQLSLALVIAATAVVSTTNIDWAKAFTLPPIVIPDIIVTHPAPGEVWHVGLNQDIEIRFLRDVTKSYQLDMVVLCQNNPGVCLDGDIVDTTDIIIGPASAGTVQKIATWKVGYRADGTLIPGDFSGYQDNTVLSLVLVEIGNSSNQKFINSGVFTITNAGGYVSQPTANTHWRLGEMQTIRWAFLGNVIKWGKPDSTGRVGSLAIYLRNDQDTQRLLVDNSSIPIYTTDIANSTSGMMLDYLVGSTNVAVGYSSQYRYWFEVDVRYDLSTTAAVVTLPGSKFIIDPAEYTIAFNTPAQDGSTVWPVETTQTIEYVITPKPGATDPFRVENRINLYLNKFYFNENQPIASIKQGIVIPADSNVIRAQTTDWYISKPYLYDLYNLAGVDVWVSAHVASSFSGQNYLSGAFRLRDFDPATDGVIMHVSQNTANPQYNPDSAQVSIDIGQTTGSVIWLNESNLPSDLSAKFGIATLSYDPNVVDPVLNSVDGGGYAGGVNVVVDNERTVPGQLVLKYEIKDFDPNSPPGGFFGLIVVNWEAVGVGTTDINLKWDGPGIMGDGTDVFPGGVAQTDLLGRVEEFGLRVTVGNPQVALVAKYYSAPMDVTADGTVTPNTFDALSSIYGNPDGHPVRFSVGFFHRDTNGNYNQLGLGSLGADAEGYFFVEIDTAGNLSGINQFTWVNQVTDIKVRIEMSTPDINDPALQPWVQNVTLNYTANNIVQTIGIINFHDAAANGQFSVNQGETATVVLDITASASYSGTVQMELGQITNKDSNVIDTTISANISDPLSGRFDITSNQTVQVTLQFTPTPSTADGTYIFSIRGYDLANTDWTLLPDPKTGELLVGGATPGEQFVVNIVEANQTVARGGTTTYNISVTRASSYIGNIALMTNIRTVGVYGSDIESAIFVPTPIVFGPGDVVVPGGPILTKTATLTIQASANATQLDQDKTFSVTGSDGTNSSSDTATLRIAANTMTLHVTIPLEAGTKPVDPTKYAQVQNPNFSLRIYSGASRMGQDVNFHTNTLDQANVVIPALQPGTYQVYARTTRHLWKKATTPSAGLVVVAGTTEYTLGWPTTGLPASDYAPDNIISALDYPAVGGHINETGDDLLGDVNNDGIISSLDYSFMINLFNNAFKFNLTGDPLPDSNW